MTWKIGRTPFAYQPEACRYCARVCGSAQGRAAHERHCAARPAEPAAPTLPPRPEPPPPAATPLVTCEHCGLEAPASKRVPTWCKRCAIADQLVSARVERRPEPAPARKPEPAPKAATPAPARKAARKAKPATRLVPDPEALDLRDDLTQAIVRTIAQAATEERKRGLRLALLRARYTPWRS